eukprot:2613292-Lingulodinium_polyedra.AAC.1
MVLRAGRRRRANWPASDELARDAAMRGAPRCANEVVFWLLSPTWRLDPTALACLGPVAQTARALRAGAIELQWWRDA